MVEEIIKKYGERVGYSESTKVYFNQLRNLSPKGVEED